MNEMMIFSNPEFGNVRTVTIDGNPWFVGNDVAKALGYVKERNAIANHVDKEDALKCSLPSNSGVQETRHTTASMALERGMNVTDLQKMLGHEKLDTTMIYAKVAQESVRYSHHKYVS